MQKHVRALEALKEPVNQWDTLLVEIIKQKLNPCIREKWEDSSCESTNPTFKELITFLQRRAQFEDTKSYQKPGKSQNISEKKFSHSQTNNCSEHAFAASTTKYPCAHCQGEHSIYNCASFKKLIPVERFEAAKKATLCINCLCPNHRVLLLHFEKSVTGEPSASDPPPPPEKSVVSAHATQVSSEGLLATAIVDLI